MSIIDVLGHKQSADQVIRKGSSTVQIKEGITIGSYMIVLQFGKERLIEKLIVI